MSLVDLISADVQLTKRGKDYWGLCVFHAEKTPSFSVSSEKDLFFCFGCSKGGDSITWLRDYRGLSYQEACRIVGKELTEPISPPDPQITIVRYIEEQVDLLLEEWSMLIMEKASMRQCPEGWELNEKLDHYIKEAKALKLRDSLLALLDRAFTEEGHGP